MAMFMLKPGEQEVPAAKAMAGDQVPEAQR